MSFMPYVEPECITEREPSVDLDIEARTRDLGDGFTVRRLLPSAARRMVGPFIFVDHMGPVRLDPGHGLDVRPHPHINLATVTFLFEGEILHRDSLGSEQPIRPGAVNWMTAGRGIVHSERSPTLERKSGPRLHGMQLWVALPTAFEEVEPSFQHHPAATIPTVERPGSRLRVIAGSAYGASSPVEVLSPLFYVEALLEPGTELALPDEHRGRAAYVVSGTVSADGKSHGEGAMLVFREGVPAHVKALEAARVLLLGGAPLDGERHIWWNFVSSSTERLERAKDDWRNGRFGKVPGDETEFIPLPETP
ncbi:MAG: Pirin-related protein [Myxococcales bacterium]|nr:Pirin-related protein [Myxococcales bacterium]